LQHSQGGLFVIRSFVAIAAAADFAEEGGDTREAGDLGEEAADFGIWVFAGLEAAEEFED
jgi:hypothetical protein